MCACVCVRSKLLVPIIAYKLKKDADRRSCLVCNVGQITMYSRHIFLFLFCWRISFTSFYTLRIQLTVSPIRRILSKQRSWWANRLYSLHAITQTPSCQRLVKSAFPPPSQLKGEYKMLTDILKEVRRVKSCTCSICPDQSQRAELRFL
ncbi:unnamed protein product [Ixodes pacificus]